MALAYSLGAGVTTAVALFAAAVLGDAVIIAILNGIFNIVAIVLATYVTYVTRKLDKEVRDGGE